jgi:hypothetical protein
MSYNGSGVFTINTAGQPVVTGTTISSTTFNNLTADLATGLTTALTKDGQSTPTANIGMGAFKITNLAAGTVASDAARLDQVQGGSATFITAAGTDTITGTTSPALTAYATGNQFSFVVANTNTGAVTINVDGLGAKAITRTGTTALVAADMVAGQAVEIIYDGTRFQLVNGNSFTNLKVSGTLGVTGVATFTAQPIVSSLTASLPVFTGASKGLVSNTMTGTGNVVMSTSPTLVTPVLGAATATTLAVSDSINTPNTFGFKNRIINGGMVIDQRNAGASQTFTAAGALAYSVDRWYGYCTGANVTGQQVAGATTPTVTQNRYRFTGAASVTAVGFGQRIEQKNSYDLAGSTCTLSADLGISATLTTVTWTAYYATTTADTFGSLASPTVTSIATGTFTVGATVANFSANISIPAAATKGIQILFTVGALTAGLTWTVGNVQLEKGSTATSFDYRPYGTELALSQRYYFKTIFQSGYVATLQAFSATNAFGVLCYPPIPMRAAPSTVTTSTIGNFRLYDAAANPAAVTTTFNVAMSTGPLYCTQVSRTGSGMVAGTAVVMDVSTTSYVDASAEL